MIFFNPLISDNGKENACTQPGEGRGREGREMSWLRGPGQPVPAILIIAPRELL